MPTEPTDRDELAARWRQNEIELRRIANAPGPNRDMYADRIDRLLGEQDSLEIALGSVSPGGSRRWSAML
jgi:hypothetical protein